MDGLSDPTVQGQLPLWHSAVFKNAKHLTYYCPPLTKKNVLTAQDLYGADGQIPTHLLSNIAPIRKVVYEVGLSNFMQCQPTDWSPPSVWAGAWAMCQTPTVPKGTALPIVSHSPGPGGDSDRHLPPWRGETKPDKQTNPVPPVGGWVGRQTLSGNCTTPVRDVNVDRGAACRHAQSPEPPGPAQRSSMEQHNLPQAPIMLPTQPPPGPGQPPTAPPAGGWVGGQKTA